MSRIFQYCFFYHLGIVLFIICIAYFWLLLFRCFIVREDSRLRREDFEQQQVGRKASNPWPYWSYMLSFSSVHTGLHALILLLKPHALGIWVHTWLVMLSQAVMSIMQVFHPLGCWVWLVPLWECCGLPSIEMWFDRGEDRCCDLSNGWNGGDD
jgi:hypothetical protein